MGKRDLSQEGLKLVACITMLGDHIGAVFFPGSILRIVGRMAFPIYCFLLTEGVRHTRNPGRYGFRLLVGMVLSELPFDLLFFGGWNWGKQSVMVTLMIGFLYCVTAVRIPGLAHRMLILLPFAFLGELLKVDYGGWGVAMIGMFLLTRGKPGQQSFWLLGISWAISRATVAIGSLKVLLQPFALLAMIPISLYKGRKISGNVWIQRLFYLFYPAHLVLLYLLRGL